VRADKYVIQTGDMIITEEDIGIKKENDLSVILRSEKQLLINKKGGTIGVLGVSVDITDVKEAERLNVENAQQKTSLQEQEKFRKLVDQMAHDIRSPLMSLSMVSKQCSGLAESSRIVLREATTNIHSIACNLLKRYDKKNQPVGGGEEYQEVMLVSSEILLMLMEKRYEYGNRAVKFEPDISQENYFAFIKIEKTSFKRMISNLINNAVGALESESKTGEVVVSMMVEGDKIKVIVKDNGKGIPPAIIDKIMNNVSFTSGKIDGHGIGLTQVRETLHRNDGVMEIKSVVEEGTSITLTFPKVEAPSWIANEINLEDSLTSDLGTSSWGKRRLILLIAYLRNKKKRFFY
jgi:signal transduction histidine kinase